MCLKLSSYPAHKPAHDRYDNQSEDGELPGDEEQHGEITYNKYRILEQHFKTRHDGVLDFLHIAAHTSNDVALALLAEETKRQ